MPFRASAFAQLLKPLDRRAVKRAVAVHGGDHGVGSGANGWSCERHLKALLFGQFAGLTSLREIVAALGAQAPSFYHLNLRAPARTTLADANAARPAAVFRDIASSLVAVAAGALREEGEALIRLVDSSPIQLRDPRFSWAEASSRTRGLKLHMVYDPRARRPVWFKLTGAKTDDTVAARAMPLEAGATYVQDKGYNDFGRWAAIIAAGAVFVTRRKRNTHCRDIVDRPAEGDGILGERHLKVGHARAHGGAAKNPLWDTVLREITVARAGKNEPLVLLTNDMTRPARVIAALYKERWEIELLFKWLKQNLKIRRFLGRSENAVQIQIYVALIAFMLLRLLHHGAARSFKAPTALLLAQLKTSLFAPLRINQTTKPPPKPPSLRPPNPQACFAFR